MGVCPKSWSQSQQWTVSGSKQTVPLQVNMALLERDAKRGGQSIGFGKKGAFGKNNKAHLSCNVKWHEHGERHRCCVEREL